MKNKTTEHMNNIQNLTTGLTFINHKYFSGINIICIFVM